MALRSNTETIFGFPSPLPLRQLPTIRNIITAFHFHRRALPGNTNYHFIADMVTSELVSIWQCAGIPTITNKSISTKVERYIASSKILNKTRIAVRNTENFFNELVEYDQLFDVATCKCFETNTERRKCKCTIKIPLCEYPFYVDQKTERLQVIGGIDKKLTEHLRDRTKRFLAQEQREQKEQKRHCIDEAFQNEIDSIDNNEDFGTFVQDSDPIFQPTLPFETFQNRHSYPTLSATADRFRSSSREVVALVNAALKDLNLITPDITLTLFESTTRAEKDQAKCNSRIYIRRKGTVLCNV